MRVTGKKVLTSVAVHDSEIKCCLLVPTAQLWLKGSVQQRVSIWHDILYPANQ
jgi:hypothetical protein